MSTPSWRTCAGWASTGTASATPPTTSTSSTSGRVQLIKAGKAYVDDLSADEIREYRGTLTEPGKNSPYRNRSVEENLDLFERMQRGRVSRRLADAARQDRYGLAEPEHARPGDVPHPACRASPHRRQVVHLSDVRLRARPIRLASSKVTHSMCTLEFEDHRPLYNWFIEQLGIFPSAADRIRPPESDLHAAQQTQTAATGGGRSVRGWDDPRMPTLSGIRRRGFHARSDPQLLCSPLASRN